MSKAFTKEDAEPEGTDPAMSDVVGGTEPAPGRSRARHISQEGYKKLADELDHLRKVERPRVTREVEAAAALGDRSENAEYTYGKRRLREIDRRLRFLAKRLETLVVVQRPAADEDRIFFGATVTVEDEDGAELTYRLVGGDEIDLGKRWISVESPVGRALLGKRAGDYVTVQRPKGETELRVVAVRYHDGNSGQR